jgi:hypothetical protein
MTLAEAVSELKNNDVFIVKEDSLFLSALFTFIKDLIKSYLPAVADWNLRVDNLLLELDSNRNGILDVSEEDNSFMKILTKYQPKIIDKSRIHDFVKLDTYLKIKKQNMQNIFQRAIDSDSNTDRENYIEVLKNQIHSLNLMTFHSLNMIISLIDGNLITFYEIYESFDRLNAFNSNWENEVKQELLNIDSSLENLTQSMHEMEQKVVNEISHLTYVTQAGFSELGKSVSQELQGIGSSIRFNNLLTAIQTYELYQINKNTKMIN